VPDQYLNAIGKTLGFDNEKFSPAPEAASSAGFVLGTRPVLSEKV
jgi:hypothetical protein